MSTKQGTVALDDGTNLRNVLLVPNLSCNSIVRIAKDLTCSVTFFDDCYVLQDRTSRMSIVAGELRDGVYYYHGVPIKVKSNAVRPGDLQHKRIGHPSS